MATPTLDEVLKLARQLSILDQQKLVTLLKRVSSEERQKMLDQLVANQERAEQRLKEMRKRLP